MSKNKINISYLILQILLIIGTIYFLLAYFFDWSASFLTSNNLDAFLNCVYSLAFSILPILARKFKISFTKILETYFLIAITFHFVLGRAFNAYHTPYFSFVIHFINSFLMGVICYGMILRTNKTQSKLFMFISTLACVALIGAIWEIVEFLVDCWFNGNMQRALNSKTGEPLIGQLALRDTMLDICMDILGGIGAGLFSAFHVKGKPLYIHFELKSAKFRKPIFGTTSYYIDNKQQTKINTEIKAEKNKLE